jgi:hypothetical protein
MRMVPMTDRFDPREKSYLVAASRSLEREDTIELSREEKKKKFHDSLLKLLADWDKEKREVLLSKIEAMSLDDFWKCSRYFFDNHCMGSEGNHENAN